MKRFILIIMALSISLFAEKAKNWNGYGDIETMPACSAAILVYSSGYTLTDFDAIRVLIQVDDTTAAGFVNDTVKLHWGYQTFTLCKNSAGVADTSFDPRIIVDTVDVDSFGFMSVYSTDANGIAASPSHQVDTLGCSGYAVQSRTFAPEWNTHIRIWVQGLTGNQDNRKLALKMTLIRRLFRGVRSL